MTVMFLIEGREYSGFEVWEGFLRALPAVIRGAAGAEWCAEADRREAEFRPMWEAMTDEERADWVLGGVGYDT